MCEKYIGLVDETESEDGAMYCAQGLKDKRKFSGEMFQQPVFNE